MPAFARAEEISDLPPLTFYSVFSEWGVDPLALLVTVWAAGFYLFGVWRLRSRGDRWSAARTTSFVGGVGIFYLATSSGLAAYDTALLSVHMVQHMALSMVVPLLLALGAPVTLALRTLPQPPRGLVLRVLHSRVAAALSFPPLTLFLFVASPWAVYFSGWYDASLRSAAVHALLHVHLVVVGALFFWPLVGTDPVPGRVGYPFRLIVVFLTLPFHAFLGVTIMSSRELVGGEWYRSLDLAWLPPPGADQQLAGGILWGAGDLLGLALFAVLFVQWLRASTREAAREDRRLDRLEATAEPDG